MAQDGLWVGPGGQRYSGSNPPPGYTLEIANDPTVMGTQAWFQAGGWRTPEGQAYLTSQREGQAIDPYYMEDHYLDGYADAKRSYEEAKRRYDELRAKYAANNPQVQNAYKNMMAAKGVMESKIARAQFNPDGTPTQWYTGVGPNGEPIPGDTNGGTGTGSGTGSGTGGGTPEYDKDAAELLTKTFEQYGISGLGPQIIEWLKKGYTGKTIGLLIRDTPQYKQRFPGMEALAQRGHALSEADYINLEKSYRAVMVSYGLPKGFYDTADDFAGFITNDVSARELDERVFAAQQFMQSSSREYMDALREYYGVDQGTALAYLLDPKKAQDVVRRQVRAAEIGGAAATQGFNLSAEQAARYAGSAVGQALDPFGQSTLAQLEDSLGKAREWATADSALTRLEGSYYNEGDAVDIAFGDRAKALESRKRAQREQARFSGSAALGRTSLSVRPAQ